MDEFSDMKPVVVNPKITFEQLIRELTEVPDEGKPNILEQLIAKLQRKKRTLKDDKAKTFSDMADLPVDQILLQLKAQTPAQVAEWFQERLSLVKFLDTVTGQSVDLIVSTHEDDLATVIRPPATIWKVLPISSVRT